MGSDVLLCGEAEPPESLEQLARSANTNILRLHEPRHLEEYILGQRHLSHIDALFVYGDEPRAREFVEAGKTAFAARRRLQRPFFLVHRGKTPQHPGDLLALAHDITILNEKEALRSIQHILRPSSHLNYRILHLDDGRGIATHVVNYLSQQMGWEVDSHKGDVSDEWIERTQKERGYSHALLTGQRVDPEMMGMMQIHGLSTLNVAQKITLDDMRHAYGIRQPLHRTDMPLPLLTHYFEDLNERVRLAGRDVIFAHPNGTKRRRAARALSHAGYSPHQASTVTELRELLMTGDLQCSTLLLSSDIPYASDRQDTALQEIPDVVREMRRYGVEEVILVSDIDSQEYFEQVMEAMVEGRGPTKSDQEEEGTIDYLIGEPHDLTLRNLPHAVTLAHQERTKRLEPKWHNEPSDLLLIEGSPAVGKTTLANMIKYQADDPTVYKWKTALRRTTHTRKAPREQEEHYLIDPERWQRMRKHMAWEYVGEERRAVFGSSVSKSEFIELDSVAFNQSGLWSDYGFSIIGTMRFTDGIEQARRHAKRIAELFLFSAHEDELEKAHVSRLHDEQEARLERPAPSEKLWRTAQEGNAYPFSISRFAPTYERIQGYFAASSLGLHLINRMRLESSKENEIALYRFRTNPRSEDRMLQFCGHTGRKNYYEHARRRMGSGRMLRTGPGVAKILLMDSLGKLYLIKRSDDKLDNAGQWSCPAGHQDVIIYPTSQYGMDAVPETLDDTARRELLEETGQKMKLFPESQFGEAVGEEFDRNLLRNCAVGYRVEEIDFTSRRRLRDGEEFIRPTRAGIYFAVTNAPITPKNYLRRAADEIAAIQKFTMEEITHMALDDPDAVESDLLQILDAYQHVLQPPEEVRLTQDEYQRRLYPGTLRDLGERELLPVIQRYRREL